jgi:hypothetical protein
MNYVRVVRDPAGNSTGEAFVQFADAPMADTAIATMNNFELAGRVLTVQVGGAWVGQEEQAAATGQHGHAPFWVCIARSD